MAKIQILKWTNPILTAPEDALNLNLTSLHITKLVNTVTLTLNYYTEFKKKHYEKALHISFDYVRAFEFNFKGGQATAPIEELSYEGAKQYIFNYMEFNFSLGDKVTDSENIVINPTTYSKPLDQEVSSFGIKLEGASELSENLSRNSKFVNTRVMSTGDKMRFQGSPINRNSTTSKISIHSFEEEREDSYIETYNTKNSIFENLKMPISNKYSITSLNSIMIGSSTNISATKNSSVLSKFDYQRRENIDYVYFERPEGDTEKSISMGFSKGPSSGFEYGGGQVRQERSLNELDKMII